MGKISIETLKFMKEIEELVERSKNGIRPFDVKADEKINDYIENEGLLKQCIYYDVDTRKTDKCGSDRYKIINNIYCGTIYYVEGWEVVVEDEAFLIYEQDDDIIYIEDGTWDLG